MWVYNQSTGSITKDGKLIGYGYAGHGFGKNNPAAQNVRMVGPVPVGLYRIGPAYLHPRLGPTTMDLVPDPRNEMYGRDLFRIHGDSSDHPGWASDGCIVTFLPIRKQFAASMDRDLEVISGVA